MSREKASLLLAAKSGDVDEVRRLLERDRYIVNCTNTDGWTPLHFACQNGDLRMIRMLVSEFNADLSVKVMATH